MCIARFSAFCGDCHACAGGVRRCAGIAAGAAGFLPAVGRVPHRPRRQPEHLCLAQSRADGHRAGAAGWPGFDPLVEDVVAIGKTPTALAREYEQRLGQYIKEPLVTVIVQGFVGPIPDQVRIIGEASQPRSLPYRADMTVLDAMIAVGGLTRYAAGNDTSSSAP